MTTALLPEKDVDTDKQFVAGTDGWRASDLDDPEIEPLWEAQHFEILDGVLTPMPAAYFGAQNRLLQLYDCLRDHLKSAGSGNDGFGFECDIVIDQSRVVKADLVWLRADDKDANLKIGHQLGKNNPDRLRIYVPPTLIIESISYGHSDRDRVTKFRWFAEFGVRHYWIFDTLQCTLECYALEAGAYKLAASSVGDQPIVVPLFEGLTINMADIWRK